MYGKVYRSRKWYLIVISLRNVFFVMTEIQFHPRMNMPVYKVYFCTKHMNIFQKKNAWYLMLKRVVRITEPVKQLGPHPYVSHAYVWVKRGAANLRNLQFFVNYIFHANISAHVYTKPRDLSNPVILRISCLASECFSSCSCHCDEWISKGASNFYFWVLHPVAFISTDSLGYCQLQLIV
jgi:hypothetical protein